jgi:hypothetical protein
MAGCNMKINPELVCCGSSLSKRDPAWKVFIWVNKHAFGMCLSLITYRPLGDAFVKYGELF